MLPMHTPGLTTWIPGLTVKFTNSNSLSWGLKKKLKWGQCVSWSIRSVISSVGDKTVYRQSPGKKTDHWNVYIGLINLYFLSLLYVWLCFWRLWTSSSHHHWRFFFFFKVGPRKSCKHACPTCPCQTLVAMARENKTNLHSNVVSKAHHHLLDVKPKYLGRKVTFSRSSQIGLKRTFGIPYATFKLYQIP